MSFIAFCAFTFTAIHQCWFGALVPLAAAADCCKLADDLEDEQLTALALHRRSCGVSLYLMLTGFFPFARDSDDECTNVVRMQRMFTRIIQGDYEPLEKVRHRKI